MNSATASYCEPAVPDRLRRRQVRQGQRRDRVLPLAVQVERGSAGDHDRQARAGLEQVADERRGGQDLLEVVEDQQQAAVPQVLRSADRPRAAFGDLAQSQRRDDRRGDQAPGPRSGRAARRRRRRRNRRSTSAASCRLRRVLPVPPGPVSVSSRVVASRRLASATSRARPTKLVSWVGRLFGAASSERSAGNSEARPGDDHLVDPFRLGQVLEAMPAQIPQLARPAAGSAPPGRAWTRRAGPGRRGRRPRSGRRGGRRSPTYVPSRTRASPVCRPIRTRTSTPRRPARAGQRPLRRDRRRPRRPTGCRRRRRTSRPRSDRMPPAPSTASRRSGGAAQHVG